MTHRRRMKRTRRITVEVSHYSISITHIESHLSERPFMVPECDVCGAPCVRATCDTDHGFDSSSQHIRNALLQRGMHAHFSAAGQLWVCSLSLHNLSENL